MHRHSSSSKRVARGSVFSSSIEFLLRELRFLLATVREPAFVGVLLGALLVWTLAYQMPFATTLHIGGDSVTHRREDDAPFLTGFNGSQPKIGNIDWWTLDPGYGYRWTSGNAVIALPGIGPGTWAITFAASSGRGEPVTSIWSTQTQTLTATLAPDDAHSYRVLLDANAAGDLALAMHTPIYDRRGQGDPRELGYVLRRVVVTPTTAGVRIPAVGQLGWLTLALALLYLLTRRLRFSVRFTLLLALGYVMLLAALLVTERLVLTVFTPTLAALLAGCYGLGAGAAGTLEWRSSMGSTMPRAAIMPAHLPLALMLLAFALRLGGLLHPHTLINDIGLHANNMLGLSSYPSDLYFTEDLPGRAGGGPSPYPPGMYLVLTPFQLLFKPSMDNRLMLLKIGVALMDSLVVGAIWLVLRRAGLGRRAAVFGAALYLAPPPLLSSFSIGEFANIGGQALAVPVLALLAGGRRQEAGGTVSLSAFRFLPSAFLLSLLCIALLGHMGVTISLVCLLVALWLAWALVAFVWDSAWRTRLGQLTGAGMLAAGAVGVFYYSAPLFVAIFTSRLQGTSTTIPSVPAAAPQPTLVRLFAPLASIFAPNTFLSPLLVLLGIVGMCVLLARVFEHSIASRTSRTTALALLLVAWWMGTLLSLGLFLIADRGVRWQHFLYPALCLGAGPALAALWRRGRAGQLVAWAGVLAPVCYGVFFWIMQLRNYLH